LNHNTLFTCFSPHRLVSAGGDDTIAALSLLCLGGSVGDQQREQLRDVTCALPMSEEQDLARGLAESLEESWRHEHARAAERVLMDERRGDYLANMLASYPTEPPGEIPNADIPPNPKWYMLGPGFLTYILFRARSPVVFLGPRASPGWLLKVAVACF